jgi:ABC-type polysaccharide/polyol phosphate export permease
MSAATDTESERRAREDEFSERHVYEPHRIGLPPLWPYLRTAWRRREFAVEMARTNLRKQHYNTVFGQLWLVINPLLLVFAYFVLVGIIRGDDPGSVFLLHLMAALFAFRFVAGSVTHGARSVVGGGRLILNIAFPRTLLPLAAVMTAFMRFLPMLGVYAVAHFVVGLPIGVHLVWAIPIVALLVVFASGITMLLAAAQVYFRDLRSFLPFSTRLWLYASPILYYAEDVPANFRGFIAANPLYPLLASWSDVLNKGEGPSAAFLAGGLAWAAGAFVVGSLFFISREREFAVRL